MSSITTSAANAVAALNNYGAAVKTVMSNRIPVSQIGASGGVATLSSAGTVPLAQMDPTTKQPGPQGVQGPSGPSAYDLHNFIDGKPNANEVIMRVVAARAFTCQANFAGSYAFLTTPPAAQVIISIMKNGVQIGTLTFAASATSGVFASSASPTFNIGDQFSMVMPATQDATLSDLTISIAGTAS